MSAGARAASAVLVTGATGYLGGHLARALAADGVPLHFLARESSRVGDLPAIGSVHRHDGTMASMARIVAEANPRLVYHLASRVLATHSAADVDGLIAGNLALATQLAEACSSLPACGLVTAGTHWQHYGNHRYSPVSLYAAMKQAVDDVLQFYAETTPLNVVSLHLADVYGPNDPRPKILNLLLDAARSGEVLVTTPGEQVIHPIHVDDVVNALRVAGGRVVNSPSDAFSQFAVRPADTVDLRTLASIVAEVSGRPLRIEWGGRPYRAREIMMPWTSGEVLPGWEPCVSLRAAVRSIFQAREATRSTAPGESQPSG